MLVKMIYIFFLQQISLQFSSSEIMSFSSLMISGSSIERHRADFT